MAAARFEHLTTIADGYLFHLEASKTDQLAKGDQKPILGKAGAALADWLRESGIEDGYLFRSITMAGLDPKLFGGHSLRSGFVTEAGMQGKPMGDIMALSGVLLQKIYPGQR